MPDAQEQWETGLALLNQDSDVAQRHGVGVVWSAALADDARRADAIAELQRFLHRYRGLHWPSTAVSEARAALWNLDAAQGLKAFTAYEIGLSLSWALVLGLGEIIGSHHVTSTTRLVAGGCALAFLMAFAASHRLWLPAARLNRSWSAATVRVRMVFVAVFGFVLMALVKTIAVDGSHSWQGLVTFILCLYTVVGGWYLWGRQFLRRI